MRLGVHKWGGGAQTEKIQYFESSVTILLETNVRLLSVKSYKIDHQILDQFQGLKTFNVCQIVSTEIVDCLNVALVNLFIIIACYHFIFLLGGKNETVGYEGARISGQ